VTANAGSYLQGTMYTPVTNVKFTGNSNTSPCFLVISLTMTYIGNSTMNGTQAACSAVGVTGPTTLNIALTE